MALDRVKRKLAAIMSADVKGYSRLMGEDEEGTIRTLNAYKEAMASLIQLHRGRIINTAGDSLLVEFVSVVDAVQCAIEVQQVLKAKNAVLPEIRRMEFRIGINLGDVIEEGETLYGDGVNIAARLESLAEAGGICISGSAFEQIENKLPLRYDYLGEHEVKNIAKPVRVYRARLELESMPPTSIAEKKPVRKRLSTAALGMVAIVVIAGAVILYQVVFRSFHSKPEVVSKDKVTLPLTGKPSIAKQIQGSWMLVSVYNEQDGKKTFQFGLNPRGSMILTPDGRFSLFMMRANLPKFAANSRIRGSTTENQAVVQGCAALFGTYKVLNEKEHMVSLHVEGSTFPNWDGEDQTRVMIVTGDEMMRLIGKWKG